MFAKHNYISVLSLKHYGFLEKKTYLSAWIYECVAKDDRVMWSKSLLAGSTILRLVANVVHQKPAGDNWQVTPRAISYTHIATPLFSVSRLYMPVISTAASYQFTIHHHEDLLSWSHLVALLVVLLVCLVVLQWVCLVPKNFCLLQ
jgi:hypothetical protein